MLIVLSKIQFSLQLSGGVCKDKGNDVCCYNFQNINDVCTECKDGTVSLQDGLCLPCNENKYGYKCLNECSCNHSQRDKASNRDGPSNMELIVYTLCVIGFLIIIGLSHFVRSYRKRSSINIPRENVGERVELRQEIVEPAYIEIYDEIDEHLIGEDNKETAVTPQLRNINAAVLKAHTDKSTSSHDDTSSYLDPYFAEEETENPSTFKESSSSDSSNCDPIIIDHTGYLNPYQPLRERQQISDGYEVTVHVHKTSESSSGSESSEEMSSSYKYSHVYQQLQKDQSTQKHEYEKATKTSNEMEY
ncbi:unnamed protein product [Mytilus edulis]|uniref:Uncharacterized protein n=1 Tax=Mytilus edulis TaxID=6550 RepID=A0A8S3QFR0_MYTED|nr:unnamed protein product [Mytilus edulis]